MTCSHKRTSIVPSRSCWNGTTSTLQPEEITLKGTRVSWCTINKSVHIKKSGNLFNDLRIYIYIYIYMYVYIYIYIYIYIHIYIYIYIYIMHENMKYIVYIKNSIKYLMYKNKKTLLIYCVYKCVCVYLTGVVGFHKFLNGYVHLYWCV